MDEVTTDSTVTQALLEKVRAGDAAALEQLFAQHRPYLRRVIEARLDRKLSARVDASDVIQETQLDAARRIEKFLDLGSVPFKVWLRKTAHERLVDIYRRHAGAARRSVNRETNPADRPAIDFAQFLTRSASTPSQQVSKKELAQRVQRALAELPAVDREILLMRSLEGLSYSEVGYILGIDPDVARKRHGRALMRLHKSLRDAGLTESQL